jgi:ligand-binding sensor domain-containing protein/DNA-binding CsgD family transcriptional regulator
LPTVLRYLLSLLLLLAAPAAGAQMPLTFGFRHLTADDGLSHNTVYALLQDRDGLLWMGTRYGLNRYDGYRFDVFLPREDGVNAPAGFTVLALCEDRAGHIWIGHRDAGISVLDRQTGRFERFPAQPDTTLDWTRATVRRIYQDSRGWIWIGTAGNGAVVFDQNRRRILHFATYRPAGQTLSGDFVFDFVEDRQGRVWIATDGGGINVFDPAARTVRHFGRRESPRLESFEKSLCLDRQGRVWIGTAGHGLFAYDPVRQAFEHYGRDDGPPGGRLSHDIVTDLACDSSGRIWVATDGGGLNRFDPETRSVDVVRSSSALTPLGLNTNALYQLLFDATGNLWIGTFNGGVNLHAAYQPPFTIHADALDYERKGLRSVLALHEDPPGRLWLGTDGGGLFRLDRRQPGARLEAAGMRPGSATPAVITCLAPAGGGKLWIGTFAGGLCRYDPQTLAIEPFRHLPADANSLSHDNVWDIEPDDAGGLWIGTLGGGLNYFAPSSRTFRRFPSGPDARRQLSSVQIVDVVLDRNRRHLWAASEDQGLNRLELATGAVQRYGTQEGLRSNNLRCLYQDRHGALWIGTEFNGLDRLDPATGNVEHFDQRDGLPSDIIHGLAEDADGLLWVSTQAGIVRREADGFRSFGRDPNFRQNQYNPKAALLASDGKLLFGGTTGFSLVDPRQVTVDPHTPHVVFTALRLLGQTVPTGDWNGRTVVHGNLNDEGATVRLSYADRGIVFEFTAADYVRPADVQYAYQLEGFDAGWNYVDGGEHRAVYSSLPGGTYRLKVKALNAAAVWSPERVLIVRVAPPFWQTWWFGSLATLAALAASYALLYFFLNRQKARYEEAAWRAEQEILRLSTENLQREVEANQVRLSASVLQNAHKNQFLINLRENISRLELARTNANGESAELRRVIRAINRELEQKDYWDQFLLTFDQTHQNFSERLHHAHPEMTTNEVRLCCFLRLEMTNPEIATILNITVNAVEQTKYRLKKKIGLEADRSLNEYIRQF